MITTDDLKRDFGNEVSAIILVCRVFSGTSSDEELTTFLHSNNIDWPLLYRIATIHQVRPVIFKVLYRFEIPGEIKEQLQTDCKRIAFHNLEHAKELVRVYDLLESSGINAIPWKGSIFCLEYYKDIGLREFSDIDFLIHPDIKDLETIKNVFSKTGYADKTDIPRDFLDTYIRHAREYYFDFYQNDHRKFHVEFHWSTASQVFDFPTPMHNSILFKDP